MIVVLISCCLRRLSTSDAFLWCEEMKCLLRKNCSNGRFSPCLLTRCWYSEESISSISRTARRICRLRSFTLCNSSSNRESRCQNRDSELSKILLLLAFSSESLKSSFASDSFGLCFQFPDVMANWDAFSRSINGIGYSIWWLNKFSCAMANADCIAEVPVFRCPICK